MGLSLVYVIVCRLFELVVPLGRRERSKELKILVLRHELSILRRQADRPRFEPRDRLLLAALSRMLPRRSRQAFLVRPETLLRWHRRLVAAHCTYPHRRPDRPPIDEEARELVLRLARENSRWGYDRIVGELRKPGVNVSATLVRNILKRQVSRRRQSVTGWAWRVWLRQHAATTLAVIFSAPRRGIVSQIIKVRVPNVDTAFARARDFGARVVDEPTTHEYGERSCMFEDLGGHRWELTQTVRDVEPEEWDGVTVAPW